MSTTLGKKMRDRHADIQCRRVIGGVIYDTATASKLLQSWYDEDLECQMHGPQHPYDIGTVLFVNKWNQHFLYHFNDALDWDTETIMPVTREQAIDWAEKHAPSETVEDIFGPLKEAGEP